MGSYPKKRAMPTGGKNHSAISEGSPRLLASLSKDEKAKAKWITRQLRGRATVTEADGVLISELAILLVREEECRAAIAAEGLQVQSTRMDNHGVAHIRTVLHPLIRVESDCRRQIIAICKTLGMSPLDRDKSKILLPDAPDGPQPGSVDYLEAQAAKVKEETNVADEVD